MVRVRKTCSYQLKVNSQVGLAALSCNPSYVSSTPASFTRPEFEQTPPRQTHPNIKKQGPSNERTNPRQHHPTRNPRGHR